MILNDYIFESKNGLINISANTLKEAKKIAYKNKDVDVNAYVIKGKKISK